VPDKKTAARPLQVSWSGLKRYEECKQKHKLVISGKSEPVDGRVFLPGTVADRIMRAWLASENPRPGEMVRMVPAVFQKYAYDNPEYFIKWRSPNDPALVQNFVRSSLQALEPLLLKHVLPHGFIPELRFKVPITIPWLDGTPTTIILVGGIDIVTMTLDTRTFTLWDLKMTRSDDYARKVLGQLIFYSMAFSHMTDDNTQPRSVGFMMPALKRPVVTYTVTDEQRAAMVSRVLRMAHSIWQRDWDTRETNDLCGRCEVRRLCPKFDIKPVRSEGGAMIASIDAAAARRRLLAANTVEDR
jgi:hypothetical protein